MTDPNLNPRSWSTRIRETFGFDLRSLALFRICLGLMIIADLILRSQTLTAMYTDDGYFTRDLAKTYSLINDMSYGVQSSTYWSLHAISGTLQWQMVLFGIAALAAIFLIAGAWTRIATVISWVLIISLQARNPLILTSGDGLLKMMIFWSIFLPLGKVWSIDAIRKRSEASRPPNFYALSVATIGFMVQLFCMYFFAGIAKWNEIWISGNAMEYVLRLNIYATDLGVWLLNYPQMLKIIAWTTLYGEIFLPWLFFVPFFVTHIRVSLMAIFWMLHLSIALSMDIGLFSYISMLAWLPFIPGAVWNLFRAPVPHTVQEQHRSTPLNLGLKIATSVVCLFFLYLTLAWNIANIDYDYCKRAVPRPVRWFGLVLNMHQHFKMFDYPPSQSPWFVYAAVLRNGESVDVLRGGTPLDEERPTSVRETIQNHHWRKLHRNLVAYRYPVFNVFRQQLADYAVKHWNQQHDQPDQVIKLQVKCFLEHVGPDYNAINRTSETWGLYESKEAAGTGFENFAKELGIDF
jgi:hypothetical protein